MLQLMVCLLTNPVVMSVVTVDVCHIHLDDGLCSGFWTIVKKPEYLTNRHPNVCDIYYYEHQYFNGVNPADQLEGKASILSDRFDPHDVRKQLLWPRRSVPAQLERYSVICTHWKYLPSHLHANMPATKP